MQLYTSLVRLKQAMNGGQLPPMTPLTPQALEIIDPTLIDGMGSIRESEAKGLLCPVRGCGEWRHILTRHIDSAHREIGGAQRVREVLSIAPGVPLVSCAFNLPRKKQGAPPRPFARGHRAGRLSKEQRTQKGVARRAMHQSVGFKNWQNRCMAQLSHQLIDLHHTLGRTPVLLEAKKIKGQGWARAVVDTFGTWNNALAQCGLSINKVSRYSRENVLEGLDAWYKAHGDLPSAPEMRKMVRAPLLPSPMAILRAFNTTSWPKAMQIAASLLNIYGGRYGLPEKKETAA